MKKILTIAVIAACMAANVNGQEDGQQEKEKNCRDLLIEIDEKVRKGDFEPGGRGWPGYITSLGLYCDGASKDGNNGRYFTNITYPISDFLISNSDYPIPVEKYSGTTLNICGPVTVKAIEREYRKSTSDGQYKFMGQCTTQTWESVIVRSVPLSKNFKYENVNIVFPYIEGYNFFSVTLEDVEAMSSLTVDGANNIFKSGTTPSAISNVAIRGTANVKTNAGGVFKNNLNVQNLILKNMGDISGICNGCGNLEEVTLQDVANLGSLTFYGANNLKKVKTEYTDVSKIPVLIPMNQNFPVLADDSKPKHSIKTGSNIGHDKYPGWNNGGYLDADEETWTSSVIEGVTNASNETVVEACKLTNSQSLQKSLSDDYIVSAVTLSDENGHYVFEDLPEGTYVIRLNIEGYDSQPSKEIEITSEMETVNGINFIVDHEALTIGPYVSVGGVSIGKPALSLVVGASETLDATITPTDATEPAVTWSSSNPAAATVDEATGLVTAVAPGEAVITATAGDYTATCTVTVSATAIPVTGVELNQTELSLLEGATVTLMATVLPTDATEPAVTWSSSNPAAATVDEATGLVTAVSPGEAIITATAGDHTATCTVTVESESITAAPELYAPDMKAYPNPFTSTVRLTGAEGCTLRVINTAGTTVHTQNIENPDETVQLEHLPASVYFLRIEKDGKTKTVKVVKN